MDINILQSNLNILNGFQNKITDLINIKNELSILYLKQNLKSELNSLNFKIRSYNKWLKTVNGIIKTLTILSETGVLEDGQDSSIYYNDFKIDKNVKSLKLTLGLQKKLIEFAETSQIADIEITRQIIDNHNNSTNMDTINSNVHESSNTSSIDNISISNLNKRQSNNFNNNTNDSQNNI